MPSVYRGERFALLTQHGKERVVAPLFAAALGAHVERVTGFDTDTLGTFTREVARAGTQLEAAREKARLAVALSGRALGLGSEGSFGAGPYGLGGWNVELVVLLDSVRGIEIVGRAQAPGQHSHAHVTSVDELALAAHEAGFPEHGLLLRPDGPDDPRVYKGLRGWDELHAAFAAAQAQSQSGVVSVENDLRAHMNPLRMTNIGAATEDLLVRMQRLCSGCGMPGFGVVERLAGLACRDCGAPTGELRAERYACVACPHGEIRELSTRGAHPAHCPECNP